jgi:hypothetical protein
VTSGQGVEIEDVECMCWWKGSSVHDFFLPLQRTGIFASRVLMQNPLDSSSTGLQSNNSAFSFAGSIRVLFHNNIIGLQSKGKISSIHQYMGLRCNYTDYVLLVMLFIYSFFNNKISKI